MCKKVCTVSDMAGRRHTDDVMRRRRRSVRTKRFDDPDSRRRIIAYSRARRVEPHCVKDLLPNFSLTE